MCIRDRDINVQPLPHMTIFDRKKQVVSDSYIFKGVMQGAAEGMEAVSYTHLFAP